MFLEKGIENRREEIISEIIKYKLLEMKETIQMKGLFMFVAA